MRVDWLAVGCLALALGACASAPPPEAELAAARNLVGLAQADAARQAPADLRRARDKLARAEAALAREDHLAARRLAEQAAADARLAAAIGESARLQSAAAAANRATRALRVELERMSQ